MIDMNKKYKTRNGYSVRILCVDMKGDYSVVAVVTEQGEETVFTFTKEGLFTKDDTGEYDLIEDRPYADFKVDDLCVVTDYAGNKFFRYFAKEIEGVAYCFPDGKTSVTACNDLLMEWPSCRKATPKEISTKTIKG